MGDTIDVSTSMPRQTEHIAGQESRIEKDASENLSSRLSNIAVVNSSLQSMSNTCHSIKESNSYVGYGITVAESSLDKALKAGKAVLGSRTLAPITNTAIQNIRYLDKEAGVMVGKFFKLNDKEDSEMTQAKEGEQQLSSDKACLDDESIIYFLGRKIIQVTSILISLPYTAPKYALSTLFGLFQGSQSETRRKRKERGSLSDEVKHMEPSPVKRKYGDRQSTSSEENETLVEILKDYVSEDDPDYVPEEHESEETSEESENEEDKKEEVKECLDLTHELDEMGVLSPDIQKHVEEMKGKINEDKTSKKRSTPKKSGDKKANETQANDEKKDPKSEEKTTNKTTNDTEQKLEEISLQEGQDNKAESTKSGKESKGSKIDPSSKTRRSSKSPLLEKLLSPGRRSRKSQKDKTKTEHLAENVSGENTTKSEVIAMIETKPAPEKSTETGSKVAEAEVDDAAKTKEKDGRKKKDKSENPKEIVKDNDVHHDVTQALSSITGPFDVFKFGGKKSK